MDVLAFVVPVKRPMTLNTAELGDDGIKHNVCHGVGTIAEENAGEHLLYV